MHPNLVWLNKDRQQEILDFFGLYESAFPPEEIEPIEQVIAEINRQDGQFFSASCYLDSAFCGLVRLCLLPDQKSALLIHIAVTPNSENKGIGRFLVEQTKIFVKENGCDKWLFAEMEPVIPGDFVRERRYSWFQKQNFELVTKDYVQPSVREGCPEVPLWLLGFRLSEFEESIEAKDIMAFFAEVYEK